MTIAIWIFGKYTEHYTQNKMKEDKDNITERIEEVTKRTIKNLEYQIELLDMISEKLKALRELGFDVEIKIINRTL